MICCSTCNVTFKSKRNLQVHLKSKKHNEFNVARKYKCSCGKSFSHRQGLHVHKSKCNFPSEVLQLQNEKEALQKKLNIYEKEQEAMKAEQQDLRAKIAILLDNNTSNITTNNINNNNNITININAFGKENLEYIDMPAIVECIDRVYKSIPAVLEKIHFDPKHPENHNIRITNKKLPYASIMDNNSKWKTVDRKDAIESMVFNGFNFLDEKYLETKNEVSERKRNHFEGFKNKFEEEDKELMKQVKTDVELLIINGSE